MSDLHVKLGEENGDGRKHLTYQYGDLAFPDSIDVISAYQREESIKRACNHFGASPENLQELSRQLAALAALADEPGGTNGGGKRMDFGLIAADELLRRDYPIEYLIPGVLAKGQHCLLGGPSKVLKSLFSTDLVISLAKADCFLGHFPVRRPVKSIILSGESGWRLLQENVRRISRVAGATEDDLKNVLTGIILPKFTRPDHMAALGETIKRAEAEVVIIDCAYRAMGNGDGASSVFAMGDLLDSVGRIFEEQDSTLILLHHSTKHIPPGEPLELTDMAFAGFAEFAAQWILLNRITKYVPSSGHHSLWMTVGARAGHGGQYGVTADEGQWVEGQDRDWSVQVCNREDAHDEAKTRREQEKAEEDEKRLQATRKRIIDAAAKYLDGASATTIRDTAGLKPRDFTPAMASLLDDRILVPCEFTRPNRKAPYDGYKLAD